MDNSADTKFRLYNELSTTYHHKITFNGENFGQVCSRLKSPSNAVVTEKFLPQNGILASIPVYFFIFNDGKCSVYFWAHKENDDNSVKNYRILDVKAYALLDNNGTVMRYRFDEVQGAPRQKFENFAKKFGRKSDESLFPFHGCLSFLSPSNNSLVIENDTNWPKTLTEYIKMHQQDIFHFSFDIEISYLTWKNVESQPTVVVGVDVAEKD